MKRFAELLDRLSYTPSRNDKLRLLADYFAATPDPDRGWALAALTGDLSFHAAKPAMIRRAVEARVDPVLFGWSYDYVGDLAETVALIWPVDPARRPNREPELSEVVEALRGAGRTEVQGLLEGWLDALDSTGRWALLKLVTGGLRVGLSARLAKTAAAMIRPERRPLPGALFLGSQALLLATNLVTGLLIFGDRQPSGLYLNGDRNRALQVVNITAFGLLIADIVTVFMNSAR